MTIDHLSKNPTEAIVGGHVWSHGVRKGRKENRCYTHLSFYVLEA